MSDGTASSSVVRKIEIPRHGDYSQSEGCKSLHIQHYNILTTGYCDFGQSDWLPTQGI